MTRISLATEGKPPLLYSTFEIYSVKITLLTRSVERFARRCAPRLLSSAFAASNSLSGDPLGDPFGPERRFRGVGVLGRGAHRRGGIEASSVRNT